MTEPRQLPGLERLRVSDLVSVSTALRELERCWSVDDEEAPLVSFAHQLLGSIYDGERIDLDRVVRSALLAAVSHGQGLGPDDKIAGQTRDGWAEEALHRPDPP